MGFTKLIDKNKIEFKPKIRDIGVYSISIILRDLNP